MNIKTTAILILAICLIVPTAAIATLPTTANTLDETKTVSLDTQPVYKQAKLSVDTLSSKYILAYSPKQDTAIVTYEILGKSDVTLWTDIYNFRSNKVYRYTNGNCEVLTTNHKTRTVTLHRHGPAWDSFNSYVPLNTTQTVLKPTESTQITTHKQQTTLTQASITGSLTQTKYGLTGNLDGETQYLALANPYSAFHIPTATPKTLDISYTTTRSQSTNEITKQLDQYKHAC